MSQNANFDNYVQIDTTNWPEISPKWTKVPRKWPKVKLFKNVWKSMKKKSSENWPIWPWKVQIDPHDKHLEKMVLNAEKKPKFTWKKYQNVKNAQNRPKMFKLIPKYEFPTMSENMKKMFTRNRSKMTEMSPKWHKIFQNGPQNIFF